LRTRIGVKGTVLDDTLGQQSFRRNQEMHKADEVEEGRALRRRFIAEHGQNHLYKVRLFALGRDSYV